MSRKATRRAERAASLRRRILAAATTVIVGLGLAVGGVTPAMATPPGGTDNTNSASYWKNQYPDAIACYKYDPPNKANTHGDLTGSGTTVTLEEYGASWPGDRWEVLIVKGGSRDIGFGSGNAVYELPEAGVAYSAPENNGGEAPDVSHWIVCKGQTPDEPEMIVDCVQISYETGRPLNGADHINVDVVYNGVRGQINLEINENQAQDPTSTSGFHAFLKFADAFGIENVKIPISQAELDSGLLIFEYGQYFTGTWTIEWVQFNSTYFNQDRQELQFVTCGDLPTEELVVPTASMQQLTCDADGSYTLGDVEGVIWFVSINGGDDAEVSPGTYPVSAAATVDVRAETESDDYGFAAETQTEWTFGFLEPTDCVEPPCLPDEYISYTYDPATNSGVVTVEQPAGDEYTDQLCAPLYVTAAAWAFNSPTSLWTQTLVDAVEINNGVAITEVGEYEYGIPVNCGQGDIYASRTAFPNPSPLLNGPNQPAWPDGVTPWEFQERFLHNMGFDGPHPTYTYTDPGCNAETPLEPAVSYIVECGTYGSITLPDDNPYVSYTVRNASGDVVDVADAREGEFTVTAHASFPYILEDYPAGGWTYDLGEYYDCPVEADLRLTYMEECAPDDTYTFRVRNNESFAVPFSIEVYGNPSLNTSGVAEPGDTLVDLGAERTDPTQSYTAILKWGDGSVIAVDETTKASGRDKVCSITIAPLVDIDCTTDGSYTLPDVLGVTWSVGGASVEPDTYVVSDAGTVTARATADSGYIIYVDGTLRQTLDFPLVFTEPDDCAPPSFTGATSIVEECDRDAPWINFAVEVTDPDGQLTGSNARLIFVDPNGVEADYVIELGTITVDELLEGRVLWPGASVDGDGNPTGWPGWELNASDEWVETDGNFAWTRDITEVTLEVNPSMQIALAYPPPTVDCAAGPTELEPAPVITVGNCFDPENSYGLADIPGIQWFVDGNPVEPGTYVLESGDYGIDGTVDVAITVEIDDAAEGGPYGFAEGATRSWNEQFTEVTDEDCVLPVTNAFLAFTDATCLAPQGLDVDGFVFDAELAALDDVTVEDNGDYTVVFTAIGANTTFDQSPDVDVEGREVSSDGKTLTFTGSLEGPNTELCEQLPVVDPFEYTDTCLAASYTLYAVDGLTYWVTVNADEPFEVMLGENEVSKTFAANPGDYVLVTPVANPGYVLDPNQPAPLDRTFNTYPDGCQLPELANWPASATATDEVCTPFGVTSGSITVQLSTGPEENPNPVRYYLAYGTDQQQELTATTTTMPAGSYVVTAVLTDPEDSLNDSGSEPVSFPLTVGAADESDCDLPTLAITGASNAVTGVGIGAVIIILAGLGFVLRRQFVQ